MASSQTQTPSEDLKALPTGLITEGTVSKYQLPASGVTESVNFHFDKFGSATVRLGSTLLGNAPDAATIDALYFYRSSSGGSDYLLRVSNGVIHYLNGTVWTAIQTITSGRVRFATFLNYAFLVGKGQTTLAWDGIAGDSFQGSGNALGAPQGQYIETFRDRVWITGNSTYPNRLYYSDLPASVVAPSITWNIDPATGNWIDIDPSDGDFGTALHATRGTLLYFKRDHIYRVYAVNSTEPDPSINVGTYSAESVIEAKDGVYFHHSTGFYRYDYGGNVTEISRPIFDIVQAIPSSSYANVIGWTDPDHCYWFVGTYTVNSTRPAQSKTFTNMVVRYTISTQTWTHYSYPYAIKSAVAYNNGTTILPVAGDGAGNVYTINSGKTDNGTAIPFSLIHAWATHDGLISTDAAINTVSFVHEGGTGAVVSYQNEENKLPDDWRTYGTLGYMDTEVRNTLRGRRTRFKISGSSSGEPFEYNGYEIPMVVKQYEQGG